ncbi:MAG: CPBP family intramembrane metalloprotease [Armatimonadetes bacterium]|nr:CPBP family intramembrane metalloprotease [Armatimonadota bacterium]
MHQSVQMPLLNPILRIALFALISFVLLLPFSLIATVVIALVDITLIEPQKVLDSPIALLLLTCCFYVPVLIAMFICRRFLDRASLSSLGLTIRNCHMHLLIGFVGGFAMTAFVTLICILIGEASFLGFGDATSLGFAFYLLSLCFQSCMEELTMRGYILQNLLTHYNIALCISATSILFSLLHLMNFAMLPATEAHTAIIGIINIGLFGVVTALLVIRTGTLWTAIGLHWGWNFSCGIVFGSPVSGLAFNEHVMHVSWHGNEILTGGSFGLEGGIITTAILLAVTVWLIWRWRFEPSAWWVKVRKLRVGLIAVISQDKNREVNESH